MASATSSDSSSSSSTSSSCNCSIISPVAPPPSSMLCSVQGSWVRRLVCFYLHSALSSSSPNASVLSVQTSWLCPSLLSNLLWHALQISPLIEFLMGRDLWQGIFMPLLLPLDRRRTSVTAVKRLGGRDARRVALPLSLTQLSVCLRPSLQIPWQSLPFKKKKK
ncbi:hypothetical protein ACFX2G_020228 [Malus domestica]